MSKISICMATYNKNELLPNTLYAISQQDIGEHECEICIVDDGSAVDPEPIIRQYAPYAKYKRLEPQEGFIYSAAHCMDLMSPDTDVVILMSSDVVMMQDFTIQELASHLSPRQIALAEVMDAPVAPDAWSTNGLEHYSRHWDDFMSYRACHVGRMRPNEWLFFLGAILKEDLDEVWENRICCDAVTHQTMRTLGFDAVLLPYVRGLHQRHEKLWPECPIVPSCPFYCGRTRDYRGAKPGDLYQKDAQIIYGRGEG